MLDRLEKTLNGNLEELRNSGRAKGKELIIEDVIKPEGDRGPRYLVKGHGEKPFIRMNSNSYLGLTLRDDLREAEEEGATRYGVGPGAVRFISGTFRPHRDLEKKLAAFHGREEAMVFSSAYMTVNGVLTSLITKETAVISDELNHNCIINAIRLSRPRSKSVYGHNDVAELESRILEAQGARRLIVVTDGIFSMRGDHAPLKEIEAVVRKHDHLFPENAILVVDDSHGVGAFGETGRGTEEYTGGRADVLVGTLGKAYGVNGGYVVSSEAVVTYLREHAPMYIYSNPISAGEAAATVKALEILDGPEGRGILKHLRDMTGRFEKGLTDLGYEVIPGDHPVVPLMVRDTEETSRIVSYLLENGVLATGLNYPVVPKGDEEIRFQISGDHTASDIDAVLDILREYREKR
ncbi:Glycine C-acetyltransferase [Dethiosulfovibrio peptidovorans DSM 11002]|uniref:Glycine C-acetyltransferase n=1 Tax=Dethiosulfovibrio peptidovorans DSM 11002 TaxID=469381 RepID=D2Z7K2_9BACT|nr:aminotransferase class I/II-fold pyridoxal phosphate-dependent enzyme [Dethiosulfovibrio peptidovorans]EFC91449.1 Glycine C-acetyltransferase [Dethiosulfovibrio peptidovorans DSM 11002]